MTPKHPNTPPGPPGTPLVGQLFPFRRDPIDFLMRVSREYGDIARFKIGSQELFLFNHPDLIKNVLTVDHRSFIKGRGLQWAKRLLGEGLLTSEGEFHRRQRRIAQPAFHRQRIAAYGEMMTGYSVRTRERWEEEKPFDLLKEMMHLTMMVAAKTLFDTEAESEAKEIGEALSVSVEFFNRFTLPFADLLAELPVPSTLKFRKAKRRLDETVYRMIAERRASKEDRGDLLSMLLHATDEEGGTGGMTDQQLRDEAMTIFLAGHETTANALTWTWYLLSQHPDAEARLHAEIDALGGRLPAVDDLPKLTYTEKLLAESMRLYPPAWLISYRAIRDYPVGRYVVPKGGIVLMSQYVMHHDPRYYPDPFRFDPERWEPAAKAARPKFSYFPFGGGPRVCIGESFAWMEGILLLATLAQRWRLRLVPGHAVILQPLITLRPKYGMRMVAERRTA